MLKDIITNTGKVLFTHVEVWPPLNRFSRNACHGRTLDEGEGGGENWCGNSGRKGWRARKLGGKMNMLSKNFIFCIQNKKFEITESNISKFNKYLLYFKFYVFC